MPTIDFHTYSTETIQDFKPVLAKSVSPDWWKTMKVADMNQGMPNKTIRSCPAMDDWLKTGWILLANRDFHIKSGYSKTDSDDKRFMAVDPESDKWADGGNASATHPSHQTLDGFDYLGTGGPVKDAFKMKNPWCITTPKGYSCFYLDPFLFQNDYFATWQGIIDTDSFRLNYDNAQIIFYPKVDHDFVIKKGTPLCQIIPYKREEWVATYSLKSHKSFVNNWSSRLSDTDDVTIEELNRTGTKETIKSTSNYKKSHMWHSKGQFFKEDTTPDECPFDPKTGKMKSEFEQPAEIQLEMDFGDQDGS
jgi:hypothetical protein